MANSMQRALDRALVAVEEDEPAASTPPVPRRRGRAAAIAAAEAAPVEGPVQQARRRPSRTNTRLIGGHFDAAVARQLRVIAAEGDTTVQALLGEAIDLLFAKKARGSLR